MIHLDCNFKAKISTFCWSCSIFVFKFCPNIFQFDDYKKFYFWEEIKLFFYIVNHGVRGREKFFFMKYVLQVSLGKIVLRKMRLFTRGKFSSHFFFFIFIRIFWMWWVVASIPCASFRLVDLRMSILIANDQTPAEWTQVHWHNLGIWENHVNFYTSRLSYFDIHDSLLSAVRPAWMWLLSRRAPFATCTEPKTKINSHLISVFFRFSILNLFIFIYLFINLFNYYD